jgi:hypothetical protein
MTPPGALRDREMGRVGIEPTTLRLRVALGGVALGRFGSGTRSWL